MMSCNQQRQNPNAYTIIYIVNNNNFPSHIFTLDENGTHHSFPDPNIVLYRDVLTD
jgi:hypothetical protein